MVRISFYYFNFSKSERYFHFLEIIFKISYCFFMIPVLYMKMKNIFNFNFNEY